MGGEIPYFTMKQDQSPFFPFVPGHENDVIAHSHWDHRISDVHIAFP